MSHGQPLDVELPSATLGRVALDVSEEKGLAFVCLI